jgi:hypothetical protein
MPWWQRRAWCAELRGRRDSRLQPVQGAAHCRLRHSETLSCPTDIPLGIDGVEHDPKELELTSHFSDL